MNEISWAARIESWRERLKSKILENFYGPARLRYPGHILDGDWNQLTIFLFFSSLIGQKFKFFGGNCKLSTYLALSQSQYFWRRRDLWTKQMNSKLKTKSSVARSGVLTPKWCSGTPLWCGNFGSGVFIKKGDFSILTCYFH